MPGVGGEEVLVHLRKICRRVPILLISGNADPALVDGFRAPPDDLVSKPFTPNMLAERLAALIPNS